MTKVAHIVTTESVIVNFNGRTHSVLKDDPAYKQILDAINREAWDEIPTLVDRAKEVEKKSNGLFRLVDGFIVFDNNRKVPELLNGKIVTFMNEGLPFKHLVNFARNLLENPSYRSTQQLFSFLEKNQHPITPEGNFIAYKKVTRCEDGVLRDTYTKTIVNEPGNVVEMPRNQVNEDPSQTCSFGLHVANWDYAKYKYGGNSSSDIMLEVEVNPADVVAVPFDYNESKMRVCKYVVRGIVENPNENLHVIPDEEDSVENDDFSDDERDYDDDDSEDYCEECGEDLEDCDCDDREMLNDKEEIASEDLVDCESCDGTGKNEFSECDDCLGKGQVLASSEESDEDGDESETGKSCYNCHCSKYGSDDEEE